VQVDKIKFALKLICAVIQILMEQFNGLGVILENRYYGQSYPYNTSTTDELRFLTTEQSENTRLQLIAPANMNQQLPIMPISDSMLPFLE
jgi:hypothetical protein